MKKLNQWLTNAQYFLLPATCVLCSAKGLTQMDLCKSCFDSIKPIKRACHLCAEPFEQASDGLCGHCLKKRPYFDNVVACTLYKDSAKSLVNQLKNNQKLAAAKVMAQLMYQYWQQTGHSCIDAVTYVPTHPLKKRQRGFNQSYLIAKQFCTQASYPLTDVGLERVKWSDNQVGLTRKKRISNIRNAFAVKGKAVPKRVLLIDDVVTTASTANEVARVLKKAGAEQVIVLTFARTAK